MTTRESRFRWQLEHKSTWHAPACQENQNAPCRPSSIREEHTAGKVRQRSIRGAEVRPVSAADACIREGEDVGIGRGKGKEQGHAQRGARHQERDRRQVLRVEVKGLGEAVGETAVLAGEGGEPDVVNEREVHVRRHRGKVKRRGGEVYGKDQGALWKRAGTNR